MLNFSELDTAIYFANMSALHFLERKAGAKIGKITINGTGLKGISIFAVFFHTSRVSTRTPTELVSYATVVEMM